MTNRNLLVVLLSSAVAMTSPAPAALAQGTEAFVGGLLGSAIGTAIVNQQQQRRVVVQPRAPAATRRAPAPVVNTYQREENRRVQTALNYFGFPSGVPDGVMGPNSRAAAGQYQVYMGYPATGYLSDYERTFLLSSYDRAVIGGPQIGQMVAAQGQGTRGLLQAFRQEQMGVPVATAPLPVAPAPVPVAPAPVAVPQVVTPAIVDAAAPAPEAAPAPPPVTVATAAPTGLPSFMPDSAAVSMNSYCNRINLATSASGGFVTLASMGDDPFQALGEQFCLARTHAIEQGESLAGTVQGFSMAEIQAQCEAFAPSMWEYQARLATQSSAEVAGALRDFVIAIGAPPVQLSGNARICLGVGYRTDNAELALAAAQMLVGLGEEAYGELLGHHLLNGFAAPRREDRGVEWLSVATDALDAGAAPLVPVGAQARLDLLEQAIATITGAAPGPVLQDAAATVPAPVFVLPTGKPQPN